MTVPEEGWAISLSLQSSCRMGPGRLPHQSLTDAMGTAEGAVYLGAAGPNEHVPQIPEFAEDGEKFHHHY